MEHSENFYKVLNYYTKKIDGSSLWSKERVYKAVGKWITEAEYEEITGLEYVQQTQ